MSHCLCLFSVFLPTLRVFSHESECRFIVESFQETSHGEAIDRLFNGATPSRPALRKLRWRVDLPRAGDMVVVSCIRVAL
jgi:hypothetical protein